MMPLTRRQLRSSSNSPRHWIRDDLHQRRVPRQLRGRRQGRRVEPVPLRRRVVRHEAARLLAAPDQALDHHLRQTTASDTLLLCKVIQELYGTRLRPFGGPPG